MVVVVVDGVDRLVVVVVVVVVMLMLVVGCGDELLGCDDRDGDVLRLLVRLMMVVVLVMMGGW